MKRRSNKPRMKWYLKLMIFIVLAVLIFYIGSMVYLVRAKYQMNEYTVQLGNAFNAATLVNAGQTYTDPERAVIAEFDCKKSIIVPENYKALLTWLRMEHAMPLISFLDRDAALQIKFCGADQLYAEGDSDGQGAKLLFESGGEKYRMHVSGSDLWDKLLTLCMDGSYKAPNIVLN